MFSTDPDLPYVVMYTAAEWPLFRDWIVKLHALPERFLHRPCWVFSLGRGVLEDSLFETIPEDPVDPVHHPHFWEMMDDVLGVAFHDVAFRVKVLGTMEHGRTRRGYHVNGSYAAVRDFYVRRAQVVEIGEFVRARAAEPSASDEETLTRLAKAFPVGPRTRPERARLHDYLLGGGPVPPRPKRDMPKLTSIFEHVSPNDFNEVHLRALDLLVREPDQLAALERTVALSDAMFDLHARWREALFVRGVSEETVLRNATTAWLDGDPVHTRAWWVLDRIAADPGAYLARYAGDVREFQLHQHILFASRITWDTPRLRGVAEEVIAHHGPRLNASAVVDLCQGTGAARLGPLFAAHLGAMLEGRADDDVRQITAAVEAAAAMPPESD